jgi:epoxyqueuosine reductase
MQSEVLVREAKDAEFFLAAVTGNRYSLENCRSVLAVGLVYGNEGGNDDGNDGDGDDGRLETPAKIAPFARRNYYRFAVQKLQSIARKLRAEYGGNKADYRIYCNSSAVDEKKIAFESGMAEIGRNSLLLTKEYGSLFITGILALPFDCDTEGCGNPAGRSPFALCNGCGHNPPCKEACPTGAITGEYRIQKERCIQWYLSSHGDTIPGIVKTHWDSRLYGCTLCQDACIYHRRTIRGVDCALGILPAALDARKIADASGEAIKKMFRGTALGLSWLCPDGLKRNATLCVEHASKQRAVMMATTSGPAPPEANPQRL